MRARRLMCSRPTRRPLECFPAFRVRTRFASLHNKIHNSYYRHAPPAAMLMPPPPPRRCGEVQRHGGRAAWRPGGRFKMPGLGRHGVVGFATPGTCGRPGFEGAWPRTRQLLSSACAWRLLVPRLAPRPSAAAETCGGALEQIMAAVGAMFARMISHFAICDDMTRIKTSARTITGSRCSTSATISKKARRVSYTFAVGAVNAATPSRHRHVRLEPEASFRYYRRRL